MSLLLEKCKFYAEPIYSPSGKFYGMEMLTHFYNKNVKLNPQAIINSLDYRAKKSLLKKQLIDVKLMPSFFKNSAFCSLNIDEEMAHILISDSSLLNLLESIPFLWLEVNERAIRKQPRQGFAIQKLSEVCRLMMDDFGTGNTSYSALRSDIFSTVKIDKKLLWNNTTDKNDLLCIVTQLRMLCPIVIAEGVETPNYKKEAIRAGAYGLQGWLFPGCYFDNLDV